MAKINFDPELMRNIKSIYGDADLDDKTLKQLYLTWQTNPDFIRNAARQKTLQQQQYFDSPEIPRLETPSFQMPTRLEPPTEIAQDDLSGITNFSDAFKVASQKGLQQFKWRSTKANPSGLFTTGGLEESQNSPQNPPQNPPKQYISQSNDRSSTNSKSNTNSVQATTNRYAMRNTVQGGDFGIGRGLRRAGQEIGNGFMNFVNWLNKQAANNQNNRNRQINPHGYYQQGGAINNQEELQKAFMAYLIQDAQAQGIQLQSEQDLQAYAEQLGEEGIKAKYQEFIQKMKGGTMARLGAKLEYYKKLKGVCPEGEELVYFEQGGRICKACQKSQKGNKITKKANEVDRFKVERAQYRKDMKSAKDEASRDSISINKYSDQEVMANKGHKGNFKNGKWVPDRTKYAKKDACGSKMK